MTSWRSTRHGKHNRHHQRSSEEHTMAFHPYLFFGGNCRDAFTRYQQIFGGDVTLLTSKDMPGEEQMPGASEAAIMHAALMVDGNLLMGSDDPMADPFGPVQGIQVNFNTPDVAEA